MISSALLCSIFFTLSLVQTHRIKVPRETKYSLQLVIEKMLASEEMNQCTIQLFLLNSNYSTSRSDILDVWQTLFTDSLYNKYFKGRSALVISQIETVPKSPNQPSKQYQQPERNRHVRECSVVIVALNAFTFPLHTETVLRNALITPILRPSTFRNRDKYLILCPSNTVNELQKSKLIRGLKYKLVLVYANPTIIHSNWTEQRLNVEIKTFCQYGLCKNHEQALINVDSRLVSPAKFSFSAIQALFPDHEKNFYGYTLRLSTTTKVPQLLELDISVDADGKQVVRSKRGLYASVLSELSKRLNFSYEIVPSSGGGSTGHALPNGTWVGIVGDTFRGSVDFGFMAAITFQRFPYAEFCAPINFAYLGFVTGPPRQSFAWGAILWPFNPVMWMGVIFTVLVAAMLLKQLSSSYTFSQDESLVPFFQKNVKWSYLKGVVFLVRGLLEQCPEIPKHKDEISFRTFLTFWLAFCLVCSTVYRSKMVALLTFPSYDHVPSNFDELAAATMKGFKVDFQGKFGNVGYTYLKSSTNPSFMQIFKKMGREPSALKCLQRTLDEKAACIIFIVTFEELLHRNLSDQYGGSPLKFTRHDGAMFPAGVIHQYKAALSLNFKSLLFSAMETGIIPFWQQTDLNQVLDNKNQWQKANNIDINAAIWGNVMNDNLLRVKNLKGAFGMFALGTVIALFSFGAEKIGLWDKLFIWKSKIPNTTDMKF